MYEPLHQISSWVDSFRDDAFPNVSPSTIVEVNERLDSLVKDYAFLYSSFSIKDSS